MAYQDSPEYGYPIINFPEADTSLQEAGLALSQEQFDWQVAQAEERKRNISEAMAEVKAIFEGRKPIYGVLKDESRRLNVEQLGEHQEDAGRNMRFALARAGNVGGSTQIDKNREMAERMSLGTAKAEIHAQQQADQLRSQDDALRSSLMGLAASGAIGGSQMKGAASGMGGNQAASYFKDIGRTFGGLSTQIGSAGRQPKPQQQQQQSYGY